MALKEARIELKIKNNVLYVEIMKRGTSVRQFCTRFGFYDSVVGCLLNLKMSPWSKTSTDGWRKTPRELSELFKMLPEDLFPVSLYVLEKTEAVIEVSIDSSLTYHPALMLESPETLYLRKEAEEETEGELHRLLSTLRPRYRGVLCDYYGVGGDGTRMTLVELGQKHNITGTRIRQMINISMKRLSQRVEGERLAREHNEHMKGAEGNNIN